MLKSEWLVSGYDAIVSINHEFVIDAYDHVFNEVGLENYIRGFSATPIQ